MLENANMYTCTAQAGLRLLIIIIIIISIIVLLQPNTAPLNQSLCKSICTHNYT